MLFLTPAIAVARLQSDTYILADTGRVVDLYTNRGGVGPNASGNEFAAGEEVILAARATYNDYPVQNVPVAFLVKNGLNETIALLVATTDENGMAYTRFRIPYLLSSEGVWTVMASVDIACTGVSDTVTFRVILHRFVGGYAISLNGRDSERISAMYLVSLTILTLSFLLASCSRRLLSA